MTKHKIIFFGTDEFAAIVLEYLMEKNAGISAVVTTPDEPAGRKKILRISHVHQRALHYNLPVLQPTKFDHETLAELQGYGADVGLLAVYGKILPMSVLDLFPKGIINIHPSLLPAYRGPSPIKTSLLHGDQETGITIIKLDDKMDHGPILAQSKTAILPDETLPELRDRLAVIGAELVTKIVPLYLAGDLPLTTQDETRATYTKLFSKDDGRIDWNKTDLQIYNLYRAFFDWPGVWTAWQGKRVKILRAHLDASNAFVIDQLQPEGKNPMDAQAFRNGYCSSVQKEVPLTKLFRSQAGG